MLKFTQFGDVNSPDRNLEMWIKGEALVILLNENNDSLTWESPRQVR